MKQYLIKEHPHHAGGIRQVYKFPNGYGASVIKTPYSYGGKEDLWELGVLYNDQLTYDTPITNDVLGWLTDEDVHETLVKIKELPDAHYS